MEMGLELVMLSGDNQRTTEAIANDLGLDRVVAYCIGAWRKP